MKVLHVLNELTPSGAEVMLRVAGPYWAEAGVQAELISLGERLGVYEDALRGAGYPIHHLPYGPGPRFLRDFRDHLRRHGYQAVHLHPERGNVRLGLAARSCGLPVVRSIHHPFEGGGLQRLRRGAGRGLLRARGVQHVSVSATVREWEWRAHRNPTVTVTNWIDLARFAPPAPAQRERARRELGVAPDAFCAVTVGNCRPYKNHPELLRAVASVGDPKLVLLHVGDEDEPGTDRRLAAELGVADRVRFLGFSGDPSPALHAADVFVSASLTEGFGNAVLEGLATGLPAILTDVPGSRDHRAPGRDLVWVEPTAESIAGALRQVAARAPADLADREARARRAGLEVFHPARGVRAYAELYRTIRR